jgi:hypothetical protein
MESESAFINNGIKIKHIENYSRFKSILDKMLCALCLNIVCYPVECTICDVLVCSDCNVILQIADKKCITNKCKGNIVRANKYVREVLTDLIVTCEYCEKQHILYKDIDTHLSNCNPYKNSLKYKLFRKIKERDEEINKINKEIEDVKLKEAESMTKSQIQKNNYDNLSKTSLRSALMGFNLPVQNKMELYNACIHGKVDTFKDLILNKGYNVLEEVSAPNYYWTPFHYAMHYGQLEIAKFIIDYLNNKGILDAALRLESNDGRCPLLCLLRSNSLTADKKKEFFQKILRTYPMKLSENVKKEARLRDMDRVIPNVIR